MRNNMSEEQMELSAWQEDVVVDAMTVKDLDDRVKSLVEARDKYDELNAVLKEQAERVDSLTEELVKILQALGKTSYKLDGVASISVSMRQSYQTPKTTEDKQKLFAFIEKHQGADALLGLQSINSMTLNAWAKQMFEAGHMEIDGLNLPTITPRLSVRKG